jgi:predicted dehydrogenase
MLDTIKIALIGAGSIGSHHARIFSEIDGIDLVGIVDTDLEKAKDIAYQYSCAAYRDYAEVLGQIDCASIAVPTTLHYQIALDCLGNGKDVFIEKPVTSTLREAEHLISEAEKRGLIIQVGHLERFNAGVSLVSNMIQEPRFIESSRLSPFPGRGTDVDVTLDLMIHDIDIILSLVKSDISEVRATGSKVLTNNLDIAYAWLEFQNGCIAEVVASRIADDKVRQLKVFQHNAYMKLNYMTQEVVCHRSVKNNITREVNKPEEKEPLKEQMSAFAECLRTRTRPLVSGLEGKEALEVALKISELIHNDETPQSGK